MDFSFGEQINIILKRKQMTIQDLAERYESVTGMKMTRQNLSQRLRRDNFQEQDMKLIASLLGYHVSIQLTPLEEAGSSLEPPAMKTVPSPIQPAPPTLKTTPTSIPSALPTLKTTPSPIPSAPPTLKTMPSPIQPVPPTLKTMPSPVITADGSTVHIPTLFQRQQPVGDINPLTGQEYLSNTVRRHPTMADYVQVYDRSTHEWTDVNEDYFWQFQANKKQIMGSEYQEPILI